MVEVVHSGCLEFCKSLTTNKGWVKRLFVLKRYQSSRTSALEYYKETKKDFRKQEPKGVLNLVDNYQVEIVSGEQVVACGRRHVFDVRTVEATYRMAAESQTEMDTWIRHLQMQTKLKPSTDLGIAYHVRPQQTEANKRIGAAGECTMQMSRAGIKVALHPSGSLVAEWPLKCLRRYACDEGKFHFEAGRKAPLGEGLYAFQTSDGDSMFEVLDYLIKVEAGQLVTPPPELLHSGPTPGYHHLQHSAGAQSTMTRPPQTLPPQHPMYPPPSRPPPTLPPSSGTPPWRQATDPFLRYAPEDEQHKHNAPRLIAGNGHAHGGSVRVHPAAAAPAAASSEYNVLDYGQSTARTSNTTTTVQSPTSPDANGAVYNKLVLVQPATGAGAGVVPPPPNAPAPLPPKGDLPPINGFPARRRSQDSTTTVPRSKDYSGLSAGESALERSNGSASSSLSNSGEHRGSASRRASDGPESVARDYDVLSAAFPDDMIPNKFYGQPVRPM